MLRALVDRGLAAGGAEAGLASVWYAAGVAAAQTTIFPVPPARAAKEHPGDIPDDGPAKKEDVGRPENKPCLAAQGNLAAGDLSPDYLHVAMIWN